MMMPETLLGIALLVFLALWFLINAFFPVSGVWERVVEPENEPEREQITLGQFGPFIVGRSELKGGYQNFSGIALGPKVWLKRRDYGVSALVRQGFPVEIAQDVEGQVMARLNLTLYQSVFELRGYFFPYKIAFLLKPAKVSAITVLEPCFRKYRKVEYIKEKVAQEVPISLINSAK